MKKLNLHRPIGVSETQKGLSLSVSDLLKKTSSQNQELLRLNSKLVDMFKEGLTEVQEDKLLDFVPLRTSQYRDLTDLDRAYADARQYVRDQYEAYQKSKLAAEQQRRAAMIARIQAEQAFRAQQNISTPASDGVETIKPKPKVV